MLGKGVYPGTYDLFQISSPRLLELNHSYPWRFYSIRCMAPSGVQERTYLIGQLARVGGGAPT